MMKLKLFILGTLLILGTGFITNSCNNDFNFKNNNSIVENIEKNQLSYSDDTLNPVLNSITLSDTFFGFVFDVNIKDVSTETVTFHIEKISILFQNLTKNEKSSRMLATANLKDSNLKEFNGKLNILGYSNDGREYSKELNNGIDFNYFSELVPENEYIFKLSIQYYDIDDNKKNFDSNDYNSIKLDTQTSYQRASVIDINSEYIDDLSNQNYGLFKNEIILDNKYTDQIYQDDINIFTYENNQKIKIDDDNIKYSFDPTTYTYIFYLNPHKLEENKFIIDGSLTYSFNKYVSLPNLSFEKTFNILNPNNFLDPILTTEVIKSDRLFGVQNFNFKYSLEIKNDLIIDKIYVAKDSDLDNPWGLDSSLFTLSSSGNQTIPFSINATNEKQEFNDLVLVIKTTDSFGYQHTTSQTIDTFSIEPLKNISASIEQINSTRTSAIFSYSIDLGEQHKVNKATFQPTNNPDYTGVNQLKPIEFLFTDETPLEGQVKIENLIPSSTVSVDPKFKVIIDYQSAINFNNSQYEIPEFSILRTYKPNSIPSNTIKSIDSNTNKAKITWQIKKSDLGDDQLESAILNGNDSEYTMENFESNDTYIYGSFIVNELKYNTDYEFTLTYNIITWKNNIEENDKIYEKLSFTSGSKNYTYFLFMMFFIDTITSLLTLLNVFYLNKKLNKKDKFS